MKLLLIGNILPALLPAHPAISQVVSGWEFAASADLCFVAEEDAPDWFRCPESRGVVTALLGEGRDPELILLALRQGVAGYLKEPFTQENISELLESMVYRRQEQSRQSAYHTLAQESFWMRVITRRIPERQAAIEAEAARYGICTQGMIQPVFIRYRRRTATLGEGSTESFSDQNIETRIHEEMQWAFFSDFPELQVLTIAPHKLILLLFARNVEKPYEKARDGCQAFLQACPAMGLDSLCLMGDPAEAPNLASRVERLVRVGNDQVYLDNQFLPSRQEKCQLENPPQPNVEKYLALLDCGMFQTAYEELRDYFYTPSVMPKVNNSFLMNFRYQLLDGLRELRISRKSGINIMKQVSGDAENAATDSVQDFLAYFSLIISELEQVAKSGGGQRNVTEEVKIYILDHLSQDISRETIARRFYLSADYLDRLFRRAYGQTLTEFVLEARLDLAKKLLENQTLQISDVAYKAGFLNAAHFSRTFKKATGMTPNAYRKQC